LLRIYLGTDSDFPARRMNPSNFVHQWSTPQLLIHGSKDYRLPETEGIGAFHALQQLVLLNSTSYNSSYAPTCRLGIPSRLVIFPDENHWVLDHGNRCVYFPLSLKVNSIIIL